MPVLRSLHALALGDAFGETWFFRPADEVERLIAERTIAAGPWPWTDDTALALPLARMLVERGVVDQDELAAAFGNAYEADPYRNFGGRSTWRAKSAAVH